MKKRDKKLISQFLLLLIVLFGGYGIYNTYYEDTIKVANWNLQIFGLTKANNSEIMMLYADKIKDYDIVFIQEIRDVSEIAFPSLCEMLENYTCALSSRAGRSNSKEQYGIIYKKGIEIVSFKDYNPDPEDRWERPPVEIIFDINGYKLIVYNIHTDPDNVEEELEALEQIIQEEGNVMIIGDLNADCNYYNNAKQAELDNLIWVINDDEDTTVSKTNCAYDRILLNDDAYQEYKRYGVDKENIDKNVSDHYLVWVEMDI